MRPKLNRDNLRKLSRHPQLILASIRGFDQVTLAQSHINIHLEKLSNFQLDVTSLEPIAKVCKAIDILSNPCYPTAYLYLVCKIFKPEVVLETGVCYGGSSAFMLKALENTKGRLYSVDLSNVSYKRDSGDLHEDSIPENLESGFIVPSRLRSNWDLILGDSKIELPKLVKLIDHPINIFHHDSMHTYDFMMFEFETVFPKLANGGILLSDDADWNNAFEDFCKKNSLKHCIYRGKGIAFKN